VTGSARQFSEFVVTDLSFGGGSKIAARARMKARLTPLSKQAISRGYVAHGCFSAGFVKEGLSIFSKTLKTKSKTHKSSPGHANAYHNIPLTYKSIAY